MTGKQESKYSMELAVRDFFNKNATITATIPNFGTLFPQYTTNINQIQVIREQQETDKSGIADNKDLLRSDLVYKALDVSRKTEVYAKMTNNLILAKEVHYSETELNKAADSKLKDKAILIHDKANANIAALATYGITATTLTALKNAIDLFNAAIPSTRIGKTETKAATDQLAKLFKTNDDLLAKFDLLVEVVRLTQPVFYSSYKDNRKVIETGTGTLTVKGFVTDAATSDPIKGATLTFVLNGNGTELKAKSAKNGDESIVKKTAEKGGYNIKTMTAGMYTVTIKKVGYVDQVVTLAVSDGELNELNIQLAKN